MLRRGLLVPLLLFAGLSSSCGRVGFSDSGPAPLIAEDAIGTGPYALTARTDAAGYVAVFAHVSPGQTSVDLVLVRTDAGGHPLEGPITLVSLLDWVSAVDMYPVPEGYRIFYRVTDTTLLSSVLMTPTGEVLETNDLGTRRDGRTAQTPSGYAVAYRELNMDSNYELRVQLFDAMLTELGSPHAPVPATDHIEQPRIAASGDNLGILYRDSALSPIASVLLGLTSDGSVRHAPIETGGAYPRDPSADGSGGFILSFRTDDETHVVRYDETGALVWSAPFVLPPNVRESQDFGSAVGDELIGLAWQSDDQTAVSAIDGAVLRLDDGTPLVARRALSRHVGGACCPVVAARDGAFGVVFDSTIRNRRGAFLAVLRP